MILICRFSDILIYQKNPGPVFVPVQPAACMYGSVAAKLIILKKKIPSDLHYEYE